MTTARHATTADADALMRARAELLHADPDAPWAVQLREYLHTGLTDGTDMAAFVIDAADHGLASCALGTVHQHLPGPGYSGLTGHIHLVSTTASHRGRGYATAVLTTLTDWLHHRGCKVINLNARPVGSPLYRNAGFTPNPMAMRRARR